MLSIEFWVNLNFNFGFTDGFIRKKNLSKYTNIYYFIKDFVSSKTIRFFERIKINLSLEILLCGMITIYILLGT